MLASSAADAISGELVGPDVTFDGASFDSRTLSVGQLFVPIVAERDGHEFIAAALDRGAAAYLTADRDAATRQGATAIVVDDTASALMRLAAWARDRLDVPVVGVTGSVGKTSTKDFIAAAVGASRSITANERSFNNEQGLPVTLLGAPDDTGALVVEMGMRGFGEITRLAEVAQPTIGVVTAVAASHTGRVGGIDGVARAKRELIEALSPAGTAVLNADDERVAAMATHTGASIITYGERGDVRVGSLELDDLARPRFEVSTPWGSATVRLSVSGAHMAANAAAALAVAGVIDGSIDAAAAALEAATISGQRMEIGRAASGAIVINDAYNANPDSTSAALRALAAIQADRRIAVLGVMAELDDPAAGHARIAQEAHQLGIELIAVDTELYGVEARTVEAAISDLTSVGSDDAVLVKASNSARLWRVAEALTGST